jgi:hypothetical protein
MDWLKGSNMFFRGTVYKEVERSVRKRILDQTCRQHKCRLCAQNNKVTNAPDALPTHTNTDVTSPVDNSPRSTESQQTPWNTVKMRSMEASKKLSPGKLTVIIFTVISASNRECGSVSSRQYL